MLNLKKERQMAAQKSTEIQPPQPAAVSSPPQSQSSRPYGSYQESTIPGFPPKSYSMHEYIGSPATVSPSPSFSYENSFYYQNTTSDMQPVSQISLQVVSQHLQSTEWPQCPGVRLQELHRISMQRLLSKQGLEQLCNIFKQQYTELPGFDKHMRLRSDYQDEQPENYPPFVLAFLALTVPWVECPRRQSERYENLASILSNVAYAKLKRGILAPPSLDMTRTLLM
ncbi:hypothetical protein PMIN03_012257 [Paraphaeosphaeria minitans]